MIFRISLELDFTMREYPSHPGEYIQQFRLQSTFFTYGELFEGNGVSF